MLRIPPPDLMPATIGTLVGAVGGESGLTASQSATLAAVLRALAPGGPSLESCPALSPTQAAAAIDDPALRRQLVHGMVVLAFLEHPPSDERLRSIESYARSLDVEDQAVRTYRDYAHEHSRLMVLDIVRQGPFAGWDRAIAKDEGIGSMIRGTLATFGHGEAPEVAGRFRALEGCPEDSLGRKLWEMYEREGWSFPGERDAVPEAASIHDWVHVLTGYAPVPIGEIQVTAFMTASSKDPHVFGTLLLAMGLYEAGAFKLPIFKANPHGSTMEQPHAPEALADALRRGVAVRADLLQGIDHWAIKDLPVDELRDRYGVPPKDEPDPTPDPAGA